jgi:diguanylate cyclase
MWSLFIEQASSTFAPFPLLLFQATAVIGILSIMLLTSRANDKQMPSGTEIGLVLGVTGYLLTFVVQDLIQNPIKPYLRNDILFLAALMGGWRGGLVCWVAVAVARLQFGGLANVFAALIDLSIQSLAGIAVYYWFRGTSFGSLSSRQVLIAWAVRLGASLLGPFLLWLLGAMGSETTIGLAMARAVFAIPSLALFAGILTVFRIDLDHRRMRKWQFDQVRVDATTGLPNRRALAEHLDEQFHTHPKQPNVLVVAEVANIVEMVRWHGNDWNDDFCRNVNTMLLSGRTQTLAETCQPSVFRYSDSALVIVIHGMSLQQVEATGLATELHRDISLRIRATQAQKSSPQLRLSVAECDQARYPNADAGLRDINLRLSALSTLSYAARAYIEPPVRYLTQTVAESADEEDYILAMLMQWIDQGRTPLAYQPKCQLPDGIVIGAEALLRAVDSRGRPISPPNVLNVVAGRQLLASFEWATLQSVAQDANRVMAAGLDLKLSANISGASLASTGFAERLGVLWHSHRLPMTGLTLELTETDVLPDVETVRENVRALGEYGVTLSLDDFGTGYSGLTVLARLPFAELKIDRTMVALIGDSRMKSAIQLAFESARRYDATLVAEGVETQEQADILIGMGVSVVQGYLYAAALPLETFIRYAQNHITIGQEASNMRGA